MISLSNSINELIAPVNHFIISVVVPLVMIAITVYMIYIILSKIIDKKSKVRENYNRYGYKWLDYDKLLKGGRNDIDKKGKG